MLAYVFWHWRQPHVDQREYESRQRRFHDALAGEPPAGFEHSVSVTVRGASWANDGNEAYEDWYLVRDSAALDSLDEGAVSAGRRMPHDAAASVAAGGTAGLYKARVGEPTRTPRFAHWFDKPAGMSYEQLFATVQPLVRTKDGGSLWVRKMVLGPTPEMCLQTVEPVTLPAAFTPIVIELRQVYPASERKQQRSGA
ncbi:MAG TPA: hypothetical protein VJ672_03840 [Gemmatimonadaceae bacterium]|nr:hypothetical protein [Gemmatimonadaceae bacterium]